MKTQLSAIGVALILAAVPVALWWGSEQRHPGLFVWIVLPLAAFLAVMGYLGARSVLRSGEVDR